MTVKELIEILRQYPEDSRVLVSGYEQWEDYDWDENLILNYNSVITPPYITFENNVVYIEVGGDDEDLDYQYQSEENNNENTL